MIEHYQQLELQQLELERTMQLQPGLEGLQLQPRLKGLQLQPGLYSDNYVLIMC
jgi:hypothetical protein